MALFHSYKLEREGDEYTVILFMQPGREEFAEELGPNDNNRESYKRLESSVRSYVQERFPGLRIKAAKVMAGAMLVASVPLAGVATTFAAEAPPTAVVAQQKPSVDSQNKDVQKAVDRLASLGLTKGYEDGKYHEERDVTRAEFAAFLVRALGLEDAATVAKGGTVFNDVSAGHWASGYISVASGQDLIKGVGANKFNPEAKVTHAEAVTMVVRALGYKDTFLPGTWPGNFVAKGNELDLLEGITYTTAGTADRGAIAILVDNALDAKVVKQTTFGGQDKWEETGDTLLKDKLKIEKAEDAIVTAVPKTTDALKANEVRIGTTTYKVAAGISANDFLGTKVDIYTKTINGDKTIVYFDVQTEATDMARGVVDTIGGGEIKLLLSDGSDKEYDLAAAQTVYVGNETKAIGDVAAGQYVKVILDDSGKVAFIEAYTLDKKDVVVKEVNVDKTYVSGLKGTSNNSRINFAEKDGYKLFLNGKEINLSDVKPGDVVSSSYVKEGDKDFVYGFVTRNVVEGTLGSIKADSIKIGTKEYDTAGALTTYSLNNDQDEPELYGVAAFDEIDDSIGKTVRVYLDEKGQARHIVANVQATTNTIYGVVTKSYLSAGDQAVKVETANGEVAYGLSEDLATAPAVGDIISFKLDKDGKIDKDTYTAIKTAATITTGADAGEATVTAIDDDHGFITAGGTKYYIDNNTVLMQYYDGAAVDPSTVKWADIKDSTPGADLRAVIVPDDDNVNAKFIVFTDNYTLASDTRSAYVAGDPYFDGDWKVNLTLADGTEKTYKLDEADKAAVAEGDFIVFNVDKDNELNTIKKAVHNNAAPEDMTGTGYTVQGGAAGTAADLVKSNGIRLQGGTFTNFADKYKVFVLDLDDTNKFDNVKTGDLSDIEQGVTKIKTILNDDGEIEMVVIVK